MGDANGSEKGVDCRILSSPIGLNNNNFGAQVVVQRVSGIQENI
jgi:hypothetical protein